jgi:small subunit ribosomal protein S6
MRRYETMVIIDAMIAEDAIEQELDAIVSRIEENEGKLLFKDIWGKRKLAYEIRRKSHGFYAVFYYEADRTVPKLLERDFRIDENILRWMTLVDQPIPADIVNAMQTSKEQRRSAVEEVDTPVEPVILEKEEEI